MDVRAVYTDAPAQSQPPAHTHSDYIRQQQQEQHQKQHRTPNQPTASGATSATAFVINPRVAATIASPLTQSLTPVRQAGCGSGGGCIMRCHRESIVPSETVYNSVYV